VRTDSPTYTLLFATAVALVCSLLVASSHVLLHDRYLANQLRYKQKNVLLAAGLIRHDQRVSDAEIESIFDNNIRVRLVDLRTGAWAPDTGMEAESYDQRRAERDPERSRPAPPNKASLQRLPNLAAVYLKMDGQRVSQVILPVEGLGLFGKMYGFLALDSDTTTVHGIAFYENRETPGLGGEVTNPRWTALWHDRHAFDEHWQPRLKLIKGNAGPPREDPYHVDALSGATMTSNGITHMLHFWLGENGFGPFLANLRTQGST
jgi:Na+-transporting NADH:ubiquinone oxidoreductase subunit C